MPVSKPSIFQGKAMIHYSCDRCKRALDSETEVRYAVRMEIQAVVEPLDGEIRDDERDHLMEIHEILENLEQAEGEQIEDGTYQQCRYDLCVDCYRQFIQSPLGQNLANQVSFSEN